MTPQDLTLILMSVPIGEANALPWRRCWHNYGMGADTTFEGKIVRLAKDGKVKRRQEPQGDHFYWVYWRELVVEMPPKAEEAA